MISHVSRLNGRVMLVLTIVVLAVLLLVGNRSLVQAGPAGGSRGSSGIVRSVVKAPVVPDGDVSGANTDIVITLDGSQDPSVEGRTLLAGNAIKITLPEAFINIGLPVDTILTPGCDPGKHQCSSGILLQGWPQHPIFPMFPPGSGPASVYTTHLEGTHTFVFTALQDVTPGLAVPGPGIKQIHLMAVGFVNPDPGFYDIQVEFQTGPDEWESGTGRVHIVPQVRPSINVTSIFNGAGNPNTFYQQAGTNSEVSFPYDFFLWGRGGVPLTGVDIKMVNSNHGLMRQGKAVVGHVFIDAPKGATGQEVSADPSTPFNAPIFGIPTARLTTAKFKTGDVAGLYEVTFTVNGGNSVTMSVTADSQQPTIDAGTDPLND